MHVLIAGCGWLGTAVARELLARGDRVTGLRSTPEGAAALRARGLEALAVDLAGPGSADRVPGSYDAILALQSARGRDAASYRRAYIDANRALVGLAARNGVRALVYTGSTGLFGQRDGSDVDEATPPAPATAEGRVLQEAERALLDSGSPARILRLSGLYGPGRLWMLDAVHAGRLALGPGDEAWLNSCHQEDAVRALLAVLDRGRDGAVYHATDARPLRRRDLVMALAPRLGATPLSTPAERDPGAPNRRVLGEATRRELGLSLRWPSLLEGLEPFLPPEAAAPPISPGGP
jgi:nucleoside-diphosphate-sugar epimerase